jgi:hypothetical protein
MLVTVGGRAHADDALATPGANRPTDQPDAFNFLPEEYGQHGQQHEQDPERAYRSGAQRQHGCPATHDRHQEHDQRRRYNRATSRPKRGHSRLLLGPLKTSGNVAGSLCLS